MYTATSWGGTPGMVLVPEWCGHPREYVPWEVGANRYLLEIARFSASR